MDEGAEETIDIEQRMEQITTFRNFIDKVDQEMTMVLQSVQWDRSHFQGSPLLECPFNSHHRVPSQKLDAHKSECQIDKEEKFLPEIININCRTAMQLSSNQITDIIDEAAKTDPAFRLVNMRRIYQIINKWRDCIPDGSSDIRPIPQTFEKLQSTYTSDERRAIYDFIIRETPQFAQTIDPINNESSTSKNESKTKCKWELKAELRDMKRRRTKYKVATKSKNYSEVLREVINNQMELYSQVITSIKKEPISDGENNSKSKHKFDQSRYISQSQDKSLVSHSRRDNEGRSGKHSFREKEERGWSRDRKDRYVYHHSTSRKLVHAHSSTKNSNHGKVKEESDISEPGPSHKYSYYSKDKLYNSSQRKDSSYHTHLDNEERRHKKHKKSSKEKEYHKHKRN